jgi:chaperonin cofactor prefoldin
MKVTINNYKEATRHIDFKNLPEAARDAHKEFDSFADFYKEDKDIKEMLDNHFKIVEPYINVKRFPDLPSNHPLNILDIDSGQYKTALKEYRENKKKPKAHAKPSTKRKTTKQAPTSKKTTVKTAKRKPNEVAVMPLEIKVIKRYLNMHGKKVTERQVSLLYKVIQKAAIEKTIRKTSKYAEEIRKIGNDLASTYKQMGSTCTFQIPETLHTKLKNIVDSFGITPAIALIKRFINLYGNITKEKAQRLLTSIKNAKKNGKVSRSDNAYERVSQVQKHLEDYLENDKLFVTNVQLNGLKGIAGMGK